MNCCRAFYCIFTRKTYTEYTQENIPEYVYKNVAAKVNPYLQKTEQK